MNRQINVGKVGNDSLHAGSLNVIEAHKYVHDSYVKNHKSSDIFVMKKSHEGNNEWWNDVTDFFGDFNTQYY